MDEIYETELSSALHSGAVIDRIKSGVKRKVQAVLLRKYCHELGSRLIPGGCS